MNSAPFFILNDQLQASMKKVSKPYGNIFSCIHHLRIATRKLESLLRLFKFGISKKLFCKTNNLLGKIRKKAGTIRNHQLFLKNIDKATFSECKFKKIFTNHIQKNIRYSKAEFCDLAKKHNSKLLSLHKEVNLQIKPLPIRKCRKIKRSKIRGFKKRVEAAIRKCCLNAQIISDLY